MTRKHFSSSCIEKTARLKLYSGREPKFFKPRVFSNLKPSQFAVVLYTSSHPFERTEPLRMAPSRPVFARPLVSASAQLFRIHKK